jgi:hypothetical protein
MVRHLLEERVPSKVSVQLSKLGSTAECEGLQRSDSGIGGIHIACRPDSRLRPVKRPGASP